MPKATRKRTSTARAEPLKTKSESSASDEKPATGKPTTKKPSKDTTKPPAQDYQAGNYLLLVSLSGTHNPNITRILPTLTFSKFHFVLQIAFNWSESHMHTFRVESARTESWHPPLLYLQRYPQDSFAEANTKDEKDFTLADVLEKEEYEGKTQLVYEYDMGDSWEHEIYLLGRADANMGKAMGMNAFKQRIACLAGEGHVCAEGCGGTGGWRI
ncbi:MAG: hypothetical protein Q9218_002707 [Villophora microphyllina]